MPHPRGGPDVAVLAGDLRKRIEILDAAARRTHHASDSEAIHDLRVSARRLNAALTLWQSAMPAAACRRANRAVQRLRRALGPAREREVLLHQLQSRLRGAPAAIRLAAFPLVERLGRRAGKSARKARRLTEPERIERIVHRLERVLAKLSTVPVDEATAGLQRHVERADGAIRTALADSHDANLHRARIAVKKWRYALECIRVVQPDSGRRPAFLRDLQRTLGAIHDAAVLRDVLQREVHRLEQRQMHDHAECLRPLITDIESERLAAVQAFRDTAATLRLDSA